MHAFKASMWACDYSRKYDDSVIVDVMFFIFCHHYLKILMLTQTPNLTKTLDSTSYKNDMFFISIYEARLFALFCHIEISQITVLHAALLVL
jgi:hypothetical protein